MRGCPTARAMDSGSILCRLLALTTSQSCQDTLTELLLETNPSSKGSSTCCVLRDRFSYYLTWNLLPGVDMMNDVTMNDVTVILPTLKLHLHQLANWHPQTQTHLRLYGKLKCLQK